MYLYKDISWDGVLPWSLKDHAVAPIGSKYFGGLLPPFLSDGESSDLGQEYHWAKGPGQVDILVRDLLYQDPSPSTRRQVLLPWALLYTLYTGKEVTTTRNVLSPSPCNFS